MAYIPKSPKANLVLLAFAFLVGGALKLYSWFDHGGLLSLYIGLGSLSFGIALATWLFVQSGKQ